MANSEIKSHAKVVVIGGGVVGVSALYHLAKKGWGDDVVLLAKDLGGRTIVVTGANSGIGFVTAKQLAKQGVTSVVTGNCGISPAPHRPATRERLEHFASIAMDRPLGLAVGHALEISESIDCLRGDGPGDLRGVSLTVTSGAAAAQHPDERTVALLDAVLAFEAIRAAVEMGGQVAL